MPFKEAVCLTYAKKTKVVENDNLLGFSRKRTKTCFQIKENVFLNCLDCLHNTPLKTMSTIFKEKNSFLIISILTFKPYGKN